MKEQLTCFDIDEAKKASSAKQNVSSCELHCTLQLTTPMLLLEASYIYTVTGVTTMYTLGVYRILVGEGSREIYISTRS